MRTCGHRESAHKCSQNHFSYQPKSANPNVHQMMSRQTRDGIPTQWSVSHKKARRRLPHGWTWSRPPHAGYHTDGPGAAHHTQATTWMDLEPPTTRRLPHGWTWSRPGGCLRCMALSSTGAHTQTRTNARAGLKSTNREEG